MEGTLLIQKKNKNRDISTILSIATFAKIKLGKIIY